MKTPSLEKSFVVAWPTMWVVPDWIEAHCVVPDGFDKGAEFELYPWQLWCTVNHYRVKPQAVRGQLAPAFVSRRSQIIAPQKTGKGPWGASVVLAEAFGPAVFDGWAGTDDGYSCADHGCPCGWEYPYEPGEPMGTPWPTPLIQLTATTITQTQNVYRPLTSMIQQGPLADLVLTIGEDFVRVPGGRIDTVTSSAKSKLGNPITFALQDETGLYTEANKLRSVAETQRRGVAGMGGRSMETSNGWDPSEHSVAQRTSESKRKDIFKYHPQAPKQLSYLNKRERRQIHRYVYSGSAHVDLDAIEGEAAELLETDPSQAERFFGNRSVAGTRSWMNTAAWAKRANALGPAPAGTRVVGGFDGSDVDDWTAIRLETMGGYQFTPTFGPDRAPCIWNPADYPDEQVPREEVMAAMDEVMTTYDMVRIYCDPPYWASEVNAWVALYGDSVVIPWRTNRTVAMHEACERLRTDVTKKDTTFSHDGCETTADHMANARAAARPAKRYVLAKPSDSQKIDCVIPSVLAHEALGDVIEAGLNLAEQPTYVYTGSMTRGR